METKKYSDADDIMLIKAKIVARNAKEDLADFTPIQPSINNENLTALETSADYAMVTFIGMDKIEAQRNATELVKDLTKQVYNKTRLLKVLVETNFKEEYDAMLHHLAYPKYYRDVGKLHQEPAISLSSVITREAKGLKSEFAKKKVPVEVIDDISKLSKEIIEAETVQEKLKGSSKPITDEQRKELNKIYNQAIDICKLGQVIYAGDEIKRSRYIFSQLGGFAKKGRNGNNNEDNNITQDEDDGGEG